MNKLYLITGPAGVGKSTVSKSIASRLEKSALIEGDDIYNQFVGGRISPWKDDAPLELFWKNCLTLIDNYLMNGYDVVFNYIIKKSSLKKLQKYFKEYNIKFVVLLTSEDVIVKRDKERPLDCQMGERSLILLNEFKNEQFDSKYVLDTSRLTVEETVNKIISNNKFEIIKFDINDIKTPSDVLKYMEDNITYGWLDSSNYKHIGNMKNFRLLYRTLSLEEILENKIGTCIEQVWLMKNLFDKLKIKNKMFCTRIYESNNFNKLEEEEHMHCFLLYYMDNKVFHIEHPNSYKIGIYEYSSEEEALAKINEYYINLSGGKLRALTEFNILESNLSFKEFNNYINSLGEVSIGASKQKVK